MAIQIRWSSRYNQWTADMPNQGGCRKREYFGKDKQAAQAKFHRMMADFYEGVEESKSSRSGSDAIPLLQLAEQFLRWNKVNKAHGTFTCYRDGLKYVTRRPENAEKAADELTPGDLEVVKLDMVEKGLSARTINVMVTAVKRMYNWGMKQALVKSNPVEGVERISKHVNAPDHPEKKHLSLERARECIHICHHSPPLGDICEFILLTGMRIGEVIRVTWEDVDLEQRFLKLEYHKTSGHTNRPRTIPLCSRSAEILLNQSRDGKMSGKTIFTGINGQPFKVYALHCRLKRLRKKHPELTSFSFHKLRHTCATYLAREQVPERVAQAILGHSSALMTRHYTATASNEMLDAAEKLSQATGSIKRVTVRKTAK